MLCLPKVFFFSKSILEVDGNLEICVLPPFWPGHGTWASLWPGGALGWAYQLRDGQQLDSSDVALSVVISWFHITWQQLWGTDSGRLSISWKDKLCFFGTTLDMWGDTVSSRIRKIHFTQLLAGTSNGINTGGVAFEMPGNLLSLYRSGDVQSWTT